MEGQRELRGFTKFSQCTVQAVAFENFHDEGDFEMPSEAAHLRPQGLDSRMIGCHAHVSLTAQL
jgi:hypothetical protein